MAVGVEKVDIVVIVKTQKSLNFKKNEKRNIVIFF